MEKKLTFSLGGVDRELDFGKFWFQKFYGEITGKDPLNGSEVVLTPDRQFDFVVNIIFAGLKTTYKVKKKEIDFTIDDVMDWVGEKESDEVVDMINKYVALTTLVPGEAEAPAGA